MIWLHFVGHEGQSNATQQDTFFVSRGMCQKARKQVVIAISRIRIDFIHWTDEEERKETATRIEQEFHTPNCPLMQDGTLLRLGIEHECMQQINMGGSLPIPLR
jgi:hypothetical protein